MNNRAILNVDPRADAIGLTSPRTMQPNQILLCAPISVSPVTVAFGAIQASSAIVGRMPRYDISRGDSACIESAQFADVFARYLPALPQNQTVTPSQANESVAFCASSTVTPLFDVTLKMRETRAFLLVVTV